MLIVFLTVLGFTFPPPQPDVLCAEVLHQLRTEHRLEVVAANTVGDTLVYLLGDESRKETAHLGCRLAPIGG
jgi:hypothetical protein